MENTCEVIEDSNISYQYMHWENENVDGFIALK